jgi:hypothetical protein
MISRRATMASAGALLLTRRARAASFDPSSAADRALAFRKLAFSLNDDVFFNWLRGRRYGLVDGKLTPFWDMVVGSVLRVTDHGGGHYDVTLIETSFYTDLATGQRITHFKNPLTGKMVEINFFPPNPHTISYGPQGRTDTPTGVLAGLARSAGIGPAWVEGGDAYVVGDTNLHGEIGHTAVNDLNTYAGRLADVLDPAQKNPPSRMIFNDLNSWPPWLQMGSIQGYYFSRAAGRKAFRLADMPALWRDEMTRMLPLLARDPAGLLKG